MEKEIKKTPAKSGPKRKAQSPKPKAIAEVALEEPVSEPDTKREAVVESLGAEVSKVAETNSANEPAASQASENPTSPESENAAKSDEVIIAQNTVAVATSPASETTAKKPFNAKEFFKNFVDRYFVKAFSGMAFGLFCTLIIGTIIGQVGTLIGDNAAGKIISQVGTVAKMIMGAGIGAGIAYSLKAKKLTTFSAAVAGMVGANITNIFVMSGVQVWGAAATASIGIGDPVGAYVAAVFAIEITDLLEGRAPVDIIVVPLCAIAVGTVSAITLGIPFGMLFALLGRGVAQAVTWEPISFGILIAVIMGVLLTLPTSSAAFGIMLFRNNPLITPALEHGAALAAAAACAGCCAHMVGFAVCSFRENKWGGLISQGLGTSMLQIPNLAKNPRILIPPIIASAVAGPLASAAFGLMCDATGSGMGTAGLVGVIQTFFVSIDGGLAWWYVTIGVLVCYIIVPAIVALGSSEFMRKKNWIKFGDMKLEK